MKKVPTYLEFKKNTLLKDYRNSKSSNDKMKILVEILDLEEEIKSSPKSYASAKKKVAALK